MSESLLNRTYTPPTEGTFDPLTAGITGTLPSFYSYRPATPAPAPTPPASIAGGAVAGGGGGDSGGGIGSTPEGGLTGLGPNPGNLGSPGNLSFTDFSGRGAARGAMTGLSLGGFPGAIAGGLIGGFGPSFSNYQTTTLTPEELHAIAVEGMLGSLDAQDQMAAAEAMAMSLGQQSPTAGTGSYGFGADPTTGNTGDFGAMSAAERGESVGPPGDNTSSPGGGDESGGQAGQSDGMFAEGGLVELQGGGKVAVGPGGGLDDLIPTSIEGRRAAALSDGEFVIPADVVSMMGDGSSNAGARRLYDLVRQVRDTKTGTTRQAGPLPVGEILKRSLG
jgi:hypothetical protein